MVPQLTPGNSYFSHNQPPEIQRSKFDRSASNKFDFDAGLLIPFYADEILPGDTFEAKLHMFARLQTQLKPIMDNLYIDVHFFACPLRLVWDNFQKFMGERRNPTDSIDYLTPKLTDLPERFYTPFSNFDYMGLPTEITQLFPITTAFHSRAINLIWNEWYRDQNLQNSLPVPTGDGPDNIDANLYQQLKPRNKRKDYFTSALPLPQKGPALTLPIGTLAPITGTIVVNGTELTRGGTTPLGSTYPLSIPSSTTALNINYPSPPGSVFAAVQHNDTHHSVAQNLTANVDVGTINALRTAFQLQRFLERDNRGGTRYTEITYSHFNVESPDARLQRPEYLGGGTLNVNINPVTATAGTETAPQANLAAFGTASTNGSNIGFTYSSTEHQVLLGFISARADLNYQQGVNKMWMRNTRYDFYWPTLAHLGEQPIKTIELIAGDNDNAIFGYQERYGEYKYRQGIISGSLRSNYPQSQDIWHLAQEFPAGTVLNGSFVQEAPPIGRTLAVPSEKAFITDTFLELYCTRPMPVNAIPGWADHF